MGEFARRDSGGESGVEGEKMGDYSLFVATEGDAYICARVMLVRCGSCATFASVASEIARLLKRYSATVS